MNKSFAINGVMFVGMVLTVFGFSGQAFAEKCQVDIEKITQDISGNTRIPLEYWVSGGCYTARFSPSIPSQHTIDVDVEIANTCGDDEVGLQSFMPIRETINLNTLAPGNYRLDCYLAQNGQRTLDSRHNLTIQPSGNYRGPVPPEQGPVIGNIFIVWGVLPNPATCMANISIDMAGRTIIPQQPLQPQQIINRIPLGPIRWTINGEVHCANGSFCQSFRSLQSGIVTLRNGNTYIIYWGLMPPGYPNGSECQFSLGELH